MFYGVEYQYETASVSGAVRENIRVTPRAKGSEKGAIIKSLIAKLEYKLNEEVQLSLNSFVRLVK